MTTEEEYRNSLFAVVKGKKDICDTITDYNQTLNLPYPRLPAEFCRISKSDDQSLEEVIFDEELNFSMPVNIRDSRIAFMIVKSNQSNTANDDFLWNIT